MAQLDGKVAIVTGSTRGIGQAIAIGLAKAGAALVITGRDETALKRVFADLKSIGAQVEVVKADLLDESQIVELFSRTMQRFNRLDILVNNAGAFNDGAIESLKTADWDRVLATNLRAPFICTREAFKIMKKQGGGRIINIGSISSQRVRINTAPYCAAKAGLVGLTQSTALEGRPFVINCGCLHPGNVRHDVMPEQTNWSKEAMMTTEEIAAAAVYMACLPPHINVLEMVQMPSQQLFLARG